MLSETEDSMSKYTVTPREVWESVILLKMNIIDPMEATQGTNSCYVFLHIINCTT